ncbi:TPA: glycosyltransferase family 1 protein [Candidatus Poribacteria bacterium]|nr:glycosyltransferase family 1 protein [Candidatus Poribacteria bacterium]
MKIVQLIPGVGNTFYCENCLRDNGLIKVLRHWGHDVIMVPLYLPILTDESNADFDAPIFFGGINVYLQQKSAIFRKTPRWIDSIFDSSKLLEWVANKASMTNAEDLAETTLSMLRGEEGRQDKELERLVRWLASKQPIDVIHISNALLLGMVRRIKEELHVPVVCSLQDEDIFVDSLPESHRQIVWETMSKRAADVDAFIAVSNYYKNFMCARLGIPAERVHVVYNGINLKKHEPAASLPDPPVIGYLERQCREKGLGTLVEAFVLLKRRCRVPGLKLRVAGGKTGDDEPFVQEIRQRLSEQGLSNDVEFLPNLNREEKLAFLRTLSIMSVPAEHKEAFGVYVLESLASGVPVVQPCHGAFPELLASIGGGILCEPNNPRALATAIETLLLNPQHARELGKRGRKAVLENFGVEQMAHDVVRVLEKVAFRT